MNDVMKDVDAFRDATAVMIKNRSGSKHVVTQAVAYFTTALKEFGITLGKIGLLSEKDMAAFSLAASRMSDDLVASSLAPDEQLAETTGPKMRPV